MYLKKTGQLFKSYLGFYLLFYICPLDMTPLEIVSC